MSRRVLVVDEDESLRWSIVERLRADRREILEAAGVADAIEQVETGVDVVVLGTTPEAGEEFAALKRIHATDADAEVILLLAGATADSAADAINAGAAAAIATPVDLDDLAIRVSRALNTGRVGRELRALRDALARSSSPAILIGNSEAMQRVKTLARKVATSPGSTVLIAGERGTGKDLVARVVHHASGRAERPFASLACSSMTEAELESALFGHEHGGRDGSARPRRGLLDQTDEGSICLEDIEDLPASLQAQLLRLFEDRLFRRVGGTTDRRVDVRIIATNSRDLEAEVKAGAFRGDLYYRLNVLRIDLPPLRARSEDVPALAQHFVGVFSRKLKRPARTISEAAESALRHYAWPGNVRELRNLVERAVMLADHEVLEPADFSPLLLARTHGTSAVAFELPPEGVDLEDVERQLVAHALERSGGNQTRAAALLGLHRDQIRYRMEKFGFAKKT